MCICARFAVCMWVHNASYQMRCYSIIAHTSIHGSHHVLATGRDCTCYTHACIIATRVVATYDTGKHHSDNKGGFYWDLFMFECVYVCVFVCTWVYTTLNAWEKKPKDLMRVHVQHEQVPGKCTRQRRSTPHFLVWDSEGAHFSPRK